MSGNHEIKISIPNVDAEEFAQWSNRQKRVFLADIQRNLETRRLEGVKPGDVLIRGVPSIADIADKVDYYAATVEGIQGPIITVEFLADTYRKGHYVNTTGISIHGLDYGWLTMEDRSQQALPHDTSRPQLDPG